MIPVLAKSMKIVKKLNFQYHPISSKQFLLLQCYICGLWWKWQFAKLHRKSQMAVTKELDPNVECGFTQICGLVILGTLKLNYYSRKFWKEYSLILVFAMQANTCGMLQIGPSKTLMNVLQLFILGKYSKISSRMTCVSDSPRNVKQSARTPSG